MTWKTLSSMLLLGTSVALGCGDRPGADTEVEGGLGSVPLESAGTGEEPGLRTSLLVNSEWLEANLGDPEVVVLHVANAVSDYEAGHVPGARFVPTSALNEERNGVPNLLRSPDALARSFAEAGVTEESHVVVYGAPLPAARAFMALEYIGHGRVSLLDGGFAAWGPDNSAVPGSTSTQAAGELQPRSTSDVVVDAGWVHERLGEPSIVLIDARPPAQYTGEDPGDRVNRPGHIPGARNLFWEDLIVSSDDPRLRDEASLRALFRERGVGPGDTVVTYCRTGMQSSFAYFVARYLGYETRTYDGSFVDWSARSEYPVEEGV